MKLITDHLDLWSSVYVKKATVGRGSNGKVSAYGIQKLRELILELAVRGKLVPQDANDEPASVLLERVAKERAQLVKEGKLKKQKPLPGIANDEKPFDPPEGWGWVRLGNIGEIFNGNSISARLKETKYTNIDGGLPFIATKDVGYGWQDLSYGNGVSIPEDELKFKVAHQGAVLICAEGGSAGKKCGITKRDICFGNKLFAIELFGNIESNYLLANYLTPMFFEQFRGKMTGIIGGISLAKLKQLLVPMPPLAEQHRIVAKVDELMALCDQLEQQQTDSLQAHQTLVETLLRALVDASGAQSTEQAWIRIAEHFDTLFTTEKGIQTLKKTVVELAVTGRLVEFVTNTRRCVVKDLLSFGPRNGLSPKEVPSETNTKVLKLGATTKGFLDLDESKYVDIDIEDDSHLWIRDEDILVQRGNAAQYVGCNIVVSVSPENYIYPDLMMKLRANDEVDSYYLSLCLSSESSREHMWERMTGTSGTMPKISKGVVESIPIVLPDIETQQRVLSLVKGLVKLLDGLGSAIENSNIIQTQLADAVVEQAVE